MGEGKPRTINTEEEDLFSDIVGSGMLEAIPDTAVGPN